jgi:hypothetical protein
MSHARARKEKEHLEEEKETMHSETFNNNPFAAWKQLMDKDSSMGHHKKNLEAMAEASKVAADVVKSIAQLQSEYVKQTFEDMNKMMGELMSAPAHKADFTKHSGKVSEHMHRSTEHAKAVANKIAQSQKHAFEIMQGRAKAGMEAMKEMHPAKAKSTKH